MRFSANPHPRASLLGLLRFSTMVTACTGRLEAYPTGVDSLKLGRVLALLAPDETRRTRLCKDDA